MDVALHLAPERAKTLVGRIDVLDDGDARQRLSGDVLVIGEPYSGRLLPTARVRLARADQSCPGKRNDRLQLRESGDQGPACEARGAARRDDELERVADRWGIELPQSGEISSFRQVRHGGFPGRRCRVPGFIGKPRVQQALSAEYRG